MRSSTLALCFALVTPLAASAQPQHPPASAPAKPHVYDEQADAATQIAQALARAKKENRRVLVQWGGNWCSWCLKLNDLMTSNREIARELLYEYEVVHVDAGVPEGKNVEFASKYGADVKSNGFPFLTILSADGAVIANQETSSLELKDANGESILGDKMGHDPAKVLAFLKAHEAAPVSATAALDAALHDAKASERRVFLHFGAPWCVWCHRLEDWLARPEVASQFSRDYVDLKIDVDRMAKADEVVKKYRPNAEGGIPWFVILDADGSPMATSDGPDGNIGFPAQPAEIAHFGKMLEKTAKRLTPAERATLTASLTPPKQNVSGGSK